MSDTEVLAAAIDQILDADRGLRSREAVVDDLARRFPFLTPQEAGDAVRRAGAMLAAAVDLAFSIRADALSQTQAQRRLAAQHPGFPLASYAAALGRGMFTSR